MTRQEYLNDSQRKGAHREYYAQFVGPEQLKMARELIRRFGVGAIPLNCFDALMWSQPMETRRKLKEMGDSFTLAGNVCILKEAIQQIIDLNE